MKLHSLLLVSASAFALGLQLASAADRTWGGGTSTWTDTTPTGWNGPMPAAGDVVRIYGGTVTSDHKDQAKGMFLTIGTNGTLVCGEENFMGKLAYLTFTGGGTLTLSRTGHWKNYGAFSLPETIWVVGKSAAGAEIKSTGAAADNFINMGPTTTFQVYDGKLTISATLADSAGWPDDSTWVTAGIVKDSPGTLILSGANTYSGTTAIKTGTLLVNGSIGAGAVTVASGATLGGSGTVGGAVTSDGTVSPGASAGKLTLQSTYTQNAGGSLAIEVGGADAAQYDVLSVSGAASLGGALNVTISGGFVPAAGQSFTVLSAGSVVGTFATTGLPPVGAGLAWNVKYSASSVVLEVAAAK